MTDIMTNLESIFQKNLQAPHAVLDTAAIKMKVAENETVEWSENRQIILQSLNPEMLLWLGRMNKLFTWRGLTRFRIWSDWFRVRRLFQRIKPVIFITCLRIAGLYILIAIAYIWSLRKIIFKLLIWLGAFALLTFIIVYLIENFDAIIDDILQWLSF
ncbi:MAG: hypothetical protein JXA42_08670 [Anaerolineales bacterium]|nr:hypothetical protein [Anaerolineales bacterium]